MKHQIVHKGWGHEEIIVNTPTYCGKRLHFDKGKRASWHYHRNKTETFYLDVGRVSVLFGPTDDLIQAEWIILNPGDSLHLPAGTRHQVHALEDSVIVEFSEHDDPNDTVRVIPGD